MTDAITVSSVSKRYRMYRERNQSLKTTITRGKRARYDEFVAVNDASFSVPIGSTFGIIGSNGSGKSTLLKCLAGVLTPDNGEIQIRGRMVALLELGAGFHPELSGSENIFLNGAILGMAQEEIHQKFDEIVEFSGLERFIDMPIKNYSSGMVVRLGFAIAINVNPDILVIDEVLAVGDQTFQMKCNDKIEEFRRNGKTIVLVSHGLSTVSQMCDQVLWLEKGIVRQIGNAHEVVANYIAFSNQIESAESPALNAQSWGTGEVKLSNIALSDGIENHSGVFIAGSPIQVTFALSNNSFSGSAYVQIAIHNLHGTLIWQNGTHNSSVVFDTEGNSERLVTCKISSLPILEGVFRISVTISNESGSIVMDHVEEAAKFTILKHKLEDSGLLLLESSWDIR